MQKSIDKTRWFDRPYAAFIFFTRLPFWRMYQPPKQAYNSVVEYWPLTGWLTGGLMAATIYYGSMVFPLAVAVVLAIVARMLITGALHEDGLADFFDGFGGGGNNRERVLAIMKDSHIGTYGVLALVVYLLLLTAVLYSIASKALPSMAALTILAAAPFARMMTAQLVMMMPYARREDEAKSKTVYRRPSTIAGISLAVQGLLPMVGFVWLMGIDWQMVVFIPCLAMYFLYLFIWRRLRGYTGDCCGAVCLLLELAVCLVVCAL